MSAYETSTPDTHDAESGLWTRAKVISALMTSRAALLEAIAGLTPREAEKPMGMGKWNARETLLHIVARDQARLTEMDAVAAGTPASWQAHGPAEYARLNAEELAPLRVNSWDQALALLDSTRREVQEKITTYPETPLEFWQPSHSFGWMMEALHLHDKHHAQAIRRWRSATGI